MRASELRGVVAAQLGIGLVAVVTAACSVAGSPAASPGPTGIASAPALASPATPAPTLAPASASPAAATSPDPTLEPPPAAVLVADSTEAPGRLGSWTWDGGTNTAPWLPATVLDPVPVEGGRLSVDVDGVAVESWTAQLADEADTAGIEATIHAEGAGPPTFDAPEAGAWVLAVQVVFEDGRGDAVYSWHLVVG